MDALDVLQEMHAATKSAFQKIDEAPQADRSSFWAKLEPELKLHEEIEEQLIYDPMAQEGVLQDWHQQHEDEVSEAESLIDRINKADPAASEWLEHITELRSALEGHIAEEEEQLWPRIRSEWGKAKLEERRSAVEAAKQAGESGASVMSALQTAREMLSA